MLLILPWLFVAIVENSVLPRLRIVSKKAWEGEGRAGLITGSLCRLRVVLPFFLRDSRVSETRAHVKITQREKSEARWEEKKKTNTHVGWFLRALAFCLLYYPWGKVETTGSLRFTVYCVPFHRSQPNLYQVSFSASQLYLRSPVLVPYTCAYRYTYASIDIVSKTRPFFLWCDFVFFGATFFFYISFVVRFLTYCAFKHVLLSKARARLPLKV